MILPDVNVLVYAVSEDSRRHHGCRRWLEKALSSETPLGLSTMVLSSVVRICSHPKILSRPMDSDQLLAYCDQLLAHPRVVEVRPGERHWAIFVDLCRTASARGNLVPDAFLAALAIESGAELVTCDRDFARFPGLRWRNPLDD